MGKPKAEISYCEHCQEEKLLDAKGYCNECNAKHYISCDECGRGLYSCNCGSVANHNHAEFCSGSCAKAFYSGD